MGFFFGDKIPAACFCMCIIWHWQYIQAVTWLRSLLQFRSHPSTYLFCLHLRRKQTVNKNCWISNLILFVNGRHRPLWNRDWMNEVLSSVLFSYDLLCHRPYRAWSKLQKKNLQNIYEHCFSWHATVLPHNKSWPKKQENSLISNAMCYEFMLFTLSRAGEWKNRKN